MQRFCVLVLWVLAGGGALTPRASGGVFDPDVDGTGMTMSEYLICVPGGEQPGGPVYSYCLGRYEITNRQIVDFLNDAERDAHSDAPTRRSSNMHFTSSGTVCMDGIASVDERLFWVTGGSADFDLVYDPVAPAGQRYSVKPGRDRHPARHLSWAGALKFCNWLTVDQGPGEAHCCYTEGPDLGDWHPVVISTQAWWGKTPAHNDSTSAGRDLNDQERFELVRRYRGYRLPMDDAGLLAPSNRPYPNDYNEWLKAAAHDPAAPDIVRTNAGGWQAMPDHWMYGFGRDVNTPADANWRGSGDPFDDGTTPVDYYDGSDHGGTFATNDTNNRYGFYGLSGNVWEWGQDYGVAMTHRALYGGSWVSTPERQAAASCYVNGVATLPDLSFGLRVLRVPGPVEIVRLTASDAAPHDEFGRTVALSGDYAISGAHFDDDAGDGSGSATVYRRQRTAWVEDAKLTASDAAAGDHFGEVVAIDGDTAVVGAPLDDDAGNESGSAYVFRRDGVNWVQQAKLTASDAAAGDRFGMSVAVSGDYALIGAYADDDAGSLSGSAYVFQRTGTTWAQQAKLVASDAAATGFFGYSVSLSGDDALVGAYGDDHAGFNAGSAYVFRRDGTNWIEQAKLTPADGAPEDGFGFSVAISGDDAVVAAPWDDDAGSISGSAYVFHREGDLWVVQAKLTAADAAANYLFGHRVSISGGRVVVGAFGDTHAGTNTGSAYVFMHDAVGWVQQTKLTASDATAYDQFGQAVAISGRYVLVGAPYEGTGGYEAGSAYVYDLDPPCAPDNTIHVCGDGSGDYTTIQAGIDAAVDGDEVVVCDGTYTGPGNRDLDFSGKAITVRSADGPDHALIDCQGAGRGFNFHSGEGPASVLRGFTIANGHVTTFGGAILCDASSPTITHCTLLGNSADGGGGISCANGGSPTIANCTISGGSANGAGGIRCFSSHPRITRCTITGNSANSAGGIYCSRSDAVITNCTITGNSALSAGGIYCYLGTPTIANCLVRGNTATAGAGIYCSGNGPTIVNCTITGNAASSVGGGLHLYNSNPTIANSIIWGNSPQEIYVESASPAVTCSDVRGGWPGLGNIDADPLFVGGSDDHLAGGSPCINRGDASALPPDAADLDDDGHTTEPIPLDLDDRLRVQGCMVDMGAYEFPGPVAGDVPADFDRDCDVDETDLERFQACLLAAHVPQYNPACADARLDGDLDVDQSDFGLFQRCLSGAGVPADPGCADH